MKIYVIIFIIFLLLVLGAYYYYYYYNTVIEEFAGDNLKNIKGFEQVSGAHQDKSLVQTKQDSKMG